MFIDTRKYCEMGPFGCGGMEVAACHLHLLERYLASGFGLTWNL
jgi:hypothetical protein